jgi:phage shock protein C
MIMIATKSDGIDGLSSRDRWGRMTQPVRKIQPARLYRSRSDRMIAGVAGGIGEYFDFDPSVIRVLWVLAAITSAGTAALVYLVLAMVIPGEDELDQPEQPRRPHPRRFASGEPISAGAGGRSDFADAPIRLQQGSRHTWTAILLIAVGVVFLAANLGLLRWFNWDLFWPVLLVMAGALLLGRSIRVNAR